MFWLIAKKAAAFRQPLGYFGLQPK